MSLPVRAARRDLYANAINEALFARPGIWLTRALVYFDNRGVDGLVNGLAAALGGAPAGCGGCRPASSARTRCRMLGGAVLVIGALLRGGCVTRWTTSLLPAVLLVFPLVGAPSWCRAAVGQNLAPGQDGRAGHGAAAIVLAGRRSGRLLGTRRGGGRPVPAPVRRRLDPAFGVRFALGVDGIALVMIALIACSWCRS